MSEKTRPESWLSKIAIDCFEQISTTKNKVKSTACSPHGLYPVIDQGKNYISGYINDESKLIKITTPICIFGDHTRIIKWVEHNFVPGADGTKLLKPKGFIYPRYAYYSLCALNIPDKGYSRHFKYFKELKIDIPAWEEQKIIAEKLDTLLAQVDSTKVRLEQIPQILNRFRQAVLASAVDETQFKDSEFNKFKLSEISNFQSGFAFKSSWFTNIGSCQIVKLANIRDGHLFLENAPSYIDEMRSVEFNRFAPNIDDILISMTGTRYKKDYGFCCIIKDKKKILINQRVGRVMPLKEFIVPEYLLIFMRSELFREQFFKGETGGVNQGNVGAKHIESIIINTPTLSKQREIVRRVEQLFAYADTIEKQVNNALARVNNLTQSILAKAFRGELTAQWRAENPELISGENSAAALLEKIKAERAASGGKKASRKKS